MRIYGHLALGLNLALCLNLRAAPPDYTYILTPPHRPVAKAPALEGHLAPDVHPAPWLPGSTLGPCDSQDSIDRHKNDPPTPAPALDREPAPAAAPAAVVAPPAPPAAPLFIRYHITASKTCPWCVVASRELSTIPRDAFLPFVTRTIDLDTMTSEQRKVYDKWAAYYGITLLPSDVFVGPDNSHVTYGGVAPDHVARASDAYARIMNATQLGRNQGRFNAARP